MTWSLDQELYDRTPDDDEYHGLLLNTFVGVDMICRWNFCIYRPMYNADQLNSLANDLCSFPSHVTIEGDIHRLLQIRQFRNRRSLKIMQFIVITTNLGDPTREKPHKLIRWPSPGMKNMVLAPPPQKLKHAKGAKERTPLHFDTAADRPPPIEGTYISLDKLVEESKG